MRRANCFATMATAYSWMSREAGVTNGRLAKAVAWGDFDGDRYPDLYVSNFGAKNRLYRNLGNGTFQDVAEQLGVTQPIQSFPVWFWDFDNDAALDLFVSAYSGDISDVAAYFTNQPFDKAATLPRLYRGNGQGGFEEVAEKLSPRPPHPSDGGQFWRPGQ